MKGIYICVNCLDPTPNKVDKYIDCGKCGHKENLNNYNKLLTEIKFIIRFGYQYRLRYEHDIKTDPNLRGRYSFIELHKVFEFLGLAVISGVAGNFAYDSIKTVIKNIAQNPLIIKIQDKDFQKVLQNDKELETFIRYIEEYRNKKINADTKVIQAIFDEEQTHEKVERFLASPQGKTILKKFKKPKEKTVQKRKKK